MTRATLLLAAGVMVGCAEAGQFEPGADSVLVALSRGVDECLARSAQQWTPEAIACACPPRGLRFRGAALSCVARSGFVAFRGDGLPFRHSIGEIIGTSRWYGLAYVPSGKPPMGTSEREFIMESFSTLDPTPTALGPRWYRVLICPHCD